MKRSLILKFFIVCLSLVVVFVVSYALASDPADEPPPLPPTPGPEPTSIPESMEGAVPITTREEALKQAISLDQAWTIRDTPLTLDALLKDDTSVVVEKYSTRQEAANLYGFGTLTDKNRASEPVWVVVIKGDVTVNTTKGPRETNGITFIISQETGYMLSMGAAAISKQEE